MSYQNIMRIIPTLHAAQLAGENVKQLKKKETTTKDMVSLGAKNIVGISLIKLESDFIEGI